MSKKKLSLTLQLMDENGKSKEITTVISRDADADTASDLNQAIKHLDWEDALRELMTQ